MSFAEGNAVITDTTERVVAAIEAGACGQTDIAALRALLPIVQSDDDYCAEHGCPTFRVLMLAQVLKYLTRPKLAAAA
jgi:hypothetical protein